MERAPLSPPRVKGLSLKVSALVLLIPLVAIGLVVYALHGRGTFEPWRSLTLVTRNAEGASVGMPVTFSGFPIGNVAKMDLGDDGQVHLEVRVREKDSRWLRSTTVFTLSRPIFGAVRIDSASPNLNDPPLAAGAVLKLASSDATADIPGMIARANEILENVDKLTNEDSSFHRSLANLESITGKMSGEYGLIEGVTGSAENAKKVIDTVSRLNALTVSMNNTSARLERLLARTDERMFAQGGMMDEAHRSMAQLNTVLNKAGDSLRAVDEVLATAQVAASNARDATSSIKTASSDLVALRAEVETNIEKVDNLLDEINRKWPFARDTRIKLP